MKILYAIQATGNGHISRAMELMPYLKKYAEVDVFLSGDNSTLNPDLPVKFRSSGLSLHYSCNGQLNYSKTLLKCSLLKAIQESRKLPVDQYDLVLNDFEAISSVACRKTKTPMIHFGHQASFVSDNTPRPAKKSTVGEWIIKNYASSRINLGLHFEPYDNFIYPPVIQEAIWNASPQTLPYITVYLPSFCDKELLQIFGVYKDIQFEIFSRQTKSVQRHGHIRLIPVAKKTFQKSLIDCSGIITGAGFETPAEALYLKKKLLAIPIGGQYEQICNGAALKKLGIKVLDCIDRNFQLEMDSWLNEKPMETSIKWQTTDQITESLFQLWEEQILDKIKIVA